MRVRAIQSTAVLLLLSVISFAQSGFGGAGNSGAITVNVRMASGQPAADARIEVRDTNMGRVIKSGYTNSAGVAEFSGLALGMYEVTVSKGLVEVRDRADVRSMIAVVSFRLEDSSNQEAGNNRTVSVAQYKVPGKARKEYHKASDAVNERKLDEALKYVDKALAIYPNYAEALTLRAILKMDKNELESAETDLDSAIKIDPSYATAYFVFGANQNLQSKFDEAIQSLERGITLDPSGWQGYFELGKAQVGKQNYPQALKYLNKAQALVRVEYSPIHLVKAHALLAMKDYPSAMDELQIFLDKSPGDPHSAQARKTLEQVRAFVKP